MPPLGVECPGWYLYSNGGDTHRIWLVHFKGTWNSTDWGPGYNVEYWPLGFEVPIGRQSFWSKAALDDELHTVKHISEEKVTMLFHTYGLQK